MRDSDQFSDRWLERLDEIASGENVSSTTDDELHQLATRLVTAFEPLRKLRSSVEIKQQRLPMHFSSKYDKVSHKYVYYPTRVFLFVAMLLLSVFFVTIISIGGMAAIQRNVTNVWHDSTSLEQINGISGQLFQGEAGDNALQWYQHGMLCQVTSKVPVYRLVALAGGFEPIKSWDLLL